MTGRFFDLLRCSLLGLRDLFFERSCAVCGGSLDAGEQLVCDRCRSDIPLTYFWNYSENAAMERLFGGREEGTSGLRVDSAAALFFYRHDSPYCEIVRKFKYGRRQALGLWAARLLGSHLASGGRFAAVQAVVPVPLHWRKRWQRGFNQAEIIARGVAGMLAREGGAGVPGAKAGGAETGMAEAGMAEAGMAEAGMVDRRGVPVAARLLRRRRYTSTQTRKSSAERRSNVSGAFALREKEVRKLQAAGIRHILLVDDVLTTGATLKECIRLLQPHFSVSVATLGFVE